MLIKILIFSPRVGDDILPTRQNKMGKHSMEIAFPCPECCLQLLILMDESLTLHWLAFAYVIDLGTVCHVMRGNPFCSISTLIFDSTSLSNMLCASLFSPCVNASHSIIVSLQRWFHTFLVAASTNISCCPGAFTTVHKTDAEINAGLLPRISRRIRQYGAVLFRPAVA